ncbi:MAG: hypothetical protein JSS36_10230 [Proteobacteria bacterium]|nr:hypothetical protein [Pseudomonadota bacterium]
MGRTIGAVLGGFAAWVVVASLFNRLMRLGLEGYADAEKLMQFTLVMLAARLGSAALAQLAAGAVAARIAPAEPRAPLYTGLALLALFVPVHIHIWAHFPLWYHALFLTTLAPLVVLGGRLARR